MPKVATVIAALGAAMIAFAAIQAPPAPQRAALGQAPQTDAMTQAIQQYVKENTIESDQSIGEILLSESIGRQTKKITVERSLIGKVLPTLAKVMPVKISESDMSEIIEDLSTTEESKKVLTFSSSAIDSFDKKNFLQTHQMMIAIFPADSTKVTIALKATQRKGSFRPIVKTVTEKVCKKTFGGFYETCKDVTKTVTTPRVVTDEILEKAKTYVKSQLIQDLLKDDIMVIVDSQN